MSVVFPYDIFISYSQKDRLEAAKLQAALEARNLKVWRDQRLLDNPEASFIGEINHALERSAKVLVLWSRNSVNSAWVHAEAEKARMAQKVVLLALEPIGALLPFIPTPFNTLPILDASADGVDLEPVLRALGAEPVEGAAPGVMSLAEAHVDLSKLPETFAANLACCAPAPIARAPTSGAPGCRPPTRRRARCCARRIVVASATSSSGSRASARCTSPASLSARP